MLFLNQIYDFDHKIFKNEFYDFRMGQWSYIEKEIWQNNSVYRKKELLLDEVYTSHYNQLYWASCGLPTVKPQVPNVSIQKINYERN